MLSDARLSFGTRAAAATVELHIAPSRVFLLAPDVVAVEGSGVYQSNVPRKQYRSDVSPASLPVATSGRLGEYSGTKQARAGTGSKLRGPKALDVAGSKSAGEDCLDYRTGWASQAGSTHSASVFYTGGGFVAPHSWPAHVGADKIAPFVSD